MLPKVRHYRIERFTHTSRMQPLLQLLLHGTHVIAWSQHLRGRFGYRSSTLILNCR
jgi:hypothetical protein